MKKFLICAKCGREIREDVMWVMKCGRLVPEHRDCGMYITERSPQWALDKMADITATTITMEQNDKYWRRRYNYFRRYGR